MFSKIKLNVIFSLIICTLFFNYNIFAEEEEIYLKSISDQIQVITKDLKILKKLFIKKSDVVTLKPSASLNSTD